MYVKSVLCDLVGINICTVNLLILLLDKRCNAEEALFKQV